MTTIACRGGVMAGDTQVTGDGLVQGHLTKVSKNKAGNIIGICGSASFIRRAIEWFAVEQGTLAIRDGEGDALVLRGDGRVEFLDSYGFHTVEAPYYATGSGFHLALGAMAHGATAEEAVKAAMVHDTSTGGRIITASLLTAGE